MRHSPFRLLAARFVFRFGSLFTFVFMFGCGGSAPAPQPEPAPAAPAAQPSEWVVSDAGVGPIAIGMRAGDLQGVVEPLGTLGECVYAKPLERPELLVMLVNGVVARVDVIGPSIATAAGAHVGDSEARIAELYPAARTEPHKYTEGKYLVIDAAAGRRLVFETDGMKVTRYRSGSVPQVDWVEGCS